MEDRNDGISRDAFLIFDNMEELNMNPMDPLPEVEFANRAHIVDCDADPTMHSDAWLAETHQREVGRVKLERRQENGADDLYANGEKVVLHRSKKWENVPGSETRKELEGMNVLNANILDHLIKHPELIPESWKNDEGIFFWGTVYIDFNNELFVRFLHWQDGKWDYQCKWLTNACAGPAATLIHLPQ